MPIDPRHLAHWRWPVLLALSATVPAFYLEMLHTGPAWLAPLVYAGAALLLFARVRGHAVLHRLHWKGIDGLDATMGAALLIAALLPASHASTPALAFRLVLALPIVLRMMLTLRHLVVRGSLSYLLGLAVAVLGLCGFGFWWLEPQVQSLSDGLWLAFTTAATVGYGDLVPSTPASRIFAVFVVLLGYAVLSLVTAAVAASLVESQEQRIEREILHSMHAELKRLSAELKALRNAAGAGDQAPPDARSWPMRKSPSNSSESTSS